jgi:NADH:ubiquinone oxidoreductase subunit 5 (subunit L)/multisubunit Na+/H+ antiporter MnhA subunit
MKAIIVNRISDLFLYFSIFTLFFVFGTLDYSVVFYVSGITDFDPLWVSFIGFCILIGAVGKSAQLGLHTWLPDAMEGPTPVSALLHAATMVTAGVFLLVRCSFFLESASFILLLILFIGGLTTFMAGTIGCFQNDIKKVIAYSTCSQLGYMFLICGLGHFHVSFFHLFNHAFFKALLFLGAGSVIHALLDEQDIRKMGGLFKTVPITYISFFIGSLALAGIPYLTGFYSKDLLIELTFSTYSISSIFIY